MKRLLYAMAASAVSMLLCSCASRTIIPEEALQLPANSKIYTSSNLWYEHDGDIPCLNYQKGSILPFGTEVEIVKATGDTLRFRDVSTGRVFTIDYDDRSWLMPMEDYMKRLFTTKSQDDLAKDMKPSDFEKLKRGIVEEGMTKGQVLLAYGHPASFRTPSETDDTWIYWTDVMVSKRTVFKEDKLVAIVTLD